MKEKTVFKLHGVKITRTVLVAGLSDGEHTIPLKLIQSFSLAWKVQLSSLLPFRTNMRKLVLTLVLKGGEQKVITVSLAEVFRKWGESESRAEKWGRESDIQDKISAALQDAIVTPRS